MAINELPEEILERILSFLPGSDRIESALTCRRLAQAVTRDIWLVIEGPNAEKEEAETVFSHSFRQFRNLRLKNVCLDDFNVAFWTNVGPTIRKLEIVEAFCSPEVFYSILETCSNLESLKIRDRISEIRMFKLSELPPRIKSIQKSTRNLRHLHLEFYMKADELQHLLILMPNVSTIDLESFQRSSCPTIERRLFSDFVGRLPNILGPSRRITSLDLVSRPSDECEQLLKISSNNLRKLGCSIECFTQKAVEALLDCTKLRVLEINDFSWGPDDACVFQNILQKVPELESLSIYSNPMRCKRENLMPIFDLKKLRILHLDLPIETDSDYCTSEKFIQELSQILYLETLTIGKRLGRVDSTRFQMLASLPRLRNLEIHCLKWDAESLGIVAFSLGKLRTLVIRGDEGLVDTRVMCDEHFELKRNAPAPVDHTRNESQVELEPSHLEILELHVVPITDAGLACIAAHHRRLKNVLFSRCRRITDAGLVTLFQHEPFLEKLEIRSESGINGTFLNALGKLCPRLRSLRLYSFAEISCGAFKMPRKPRTECIIESGRGTGLPV